MGVNTHGYVNDKVTGTDIFNVIVNKFDKEAIFDIHEDKSYGSEIGRIDFKFKNEDRSLFFCIGGDDERKYEEFKNGKHAYLSLGCYGNSVEIMSEIVKCFGGYLDANDCDDEDAFYIPKDDSFKYDDYIDGRDTIVNILDQGLNQSIKIQIANQILKHKEQLLELLK